MRDNWTGQRGAALLAASAVAAFALAGPTLAGRHRVTAEQAAQFRVGVATYADVLRTLGKPTSISTDSNGQRMVIYATVRARPKAVSFVPIVGLFAGGATGESYSTIFIFGSDGLLKKSGGTVANMDCSEHLFSMGCQGDGGAAAAQAAVMSQEASAPAPSPPARVPAAVIPVPIARAATPPPKPDPRKRCRGLTSPTDPDAVTC